MKTKTETAASPIFEALMVLAVIGLLIAGNV